MDISVLIYAVIALAGVAIGWLISSYQHAQQKADQLAEREEIVAELSAAKQQLALSDHWREECELLNNELRNLRDINTSLEADLREVTTRLESTQLHAEDKIRQMINSEQRLSEQFENLANRIFEHSNRRVDEQNRQSLNSLLTPLREQLDGFRRQVQDSFGQEARERHTLAHEIRNLQQLNAQMAQEAVNLTRALKGDNKTQGNWGEVVLTRVLEASGLREGYEYETQVSIENDARSRMQPDVIVRLPQGKDVVIDAKMTLVAYERYFNAEDDYTRESALQEHIASVRNHIRLLGRKDYQQLPGLRSLDYVLMLFRSSPRFCWHSTGSLNSSPKRSKIILCWSAPPRCWWPYARLRTCGATSTRAATRSRLPTAPASCTTKCASSWTTCPQSGRAWTARRITTVRR